VLLLVLPSLLFRLAALVAIPAAGGVLAKGLNLRAQARRWDLKQRLFDESAAPDMASTGAAGGPTAVPPFPR
jgi:hypothetical protein